MPITVCLIVIGRHVPQLEFLGVLLGDQPVLPAEVQVYHRLLARSPVDAVEIAVDHAQEKGVLALYNDVLMPMLVLAENDRRRVALQGGRQLLLVEGIEEIVAAVADEPDSLPTEADSTGKSEVDEPDAEKSATPPADTATPTEAAATRVLCVGGRSDIDRAAAVLAADVLARRAIPARACGLGGLADAVGAADRSIDAIALCVVMPGSATIIHHLLRRIRQYCGPDMAVIVGCLASELSLTAAPGQPSTPIARSLGDLGGLVGDAAAPYCDDGCVGPRYRDSAAAAAIRSSKRSMTASAPRSRGGVSV
jgi:hypothetical protein